MAEPRIRTARHTIRVAAPPQRVFRLITNVDRWPHLFDTVLDVEHLGWHTTGERVRLSGTFGERCGSWTSTREINPKRLQLRFRLEQAAHPLASLGGLWRVVPKGGGAVVALDQYYTIVDDDPVDGRRLDTIIAQRGTAMLDALRRAAELDDVEDLWLGLPSRTAGRAEGVSYR